MIKFFFNKIVAAIIAALFLFMFIYIFIVYKELPSAETLRNINYQVPLRIYSADHKLIAEYGEKKRTPVTLNEIPKNLINAFLATEDANFYSHYGVDPKGMARAVVTLVSKGRKEQGGSTITMQVARNFFLSRHKTFTRKINEILLSFAIENELSKDEILELYLNKIFLGQRAYGVAAAAQVYYGKNLNELTLPEMAIIAGLPKAPSTLNPITNPQKALERRNHVLSRMKFYNYITEEEYANAVNSPLTASRHYTEIELEAPYVAEMIREIMEQQYGENAYTGGFSVTATVDSKIQQDANNALHKTLDDYDKRHGFRGPVEIWDENPSETELLEWQKKLKKYYKAANKQVAAILEIEHNGAGAAAMLSNGDIVYIPEQNIAWAYDNDHKNIFNLLKPGYLVYVEKDSDNTWRLEQRPKIEGAFVAINPNSGNVLALIGGYDYDYSQFNRAIKTKRQTGSVFKPFIYSAALDNNYNASTLINDAPIVVKDAGNEEDWRPQNHNKKFDGLTSLRTALTKSRNLVSIRILEDIGIEKAKNHLGKFGFNTEDMPMSLSLALGSSSATPLDMARAYGVFANGGFLVQSNIIDNIKDYDDKIIYQSEINKQQTLSAQNAYIINDILKDVIKKGTGRRAKILKRNDLAGKTGSTNDNVDAWFAGYNSDIVAISWMGFDNAESTKEYAASTALVMWVEFMKNTLKNIPENLLPQPTEVVTVKINPKTGESANIDDEEAIEELFYKDSAPQIDNRNVAHGAAGKKDIEDIF